MTRPPAALAALTVLSLSGCSLLTDVGWSRRPGLVLDGPPPMTSLVVPAAVRGVPFEVTASSFGSSSCTRPDGYEIDATSEGISIRLYDRTASGLTACTAHMHRFPRTITLTLDQVGVAEISVIGRAGEHDIQTIRRTIPVTDQ